MQPHNVGVIEIDGGELVDIPEIGTSPISAKVELELFSLEVKLEGIAQVLLDEVWCGSKTQCIEKSPLHVGRGWEYKAIDGDVGNVSSGFAESEDVGGRRGRGVLRDLSIAALPLPELLDTGSGDVVPENEVDLVGSSGDLIVGKVLEDFDLLSLGTRQAGGGHVVDVSLVLVGIDVEPDQDFDLQHIGPGLYGEGAPRVDQLEWLLVGDLDCDRLVAGQSARAEVDGRVDGWANEFGCHDGCCGL